MKCVVLGAGGFLGWHLCNRLKREGHYVIGVGRRQNDYGPKGYDEFVSWDLREWFRLWSDVDELYQLAGEVGGVGYIGDSNNDAEILRNSMLINCNVVESCFEAGVKRVFFASSACVYKDTGGDGALEDFDVESFSKMAAFARDKIYAEALYAAYRRNAGLTVRIGRLHNTYGPVAPYDGVRAKSVMALCRKVAEAPAWSEIEVWGDGEQKRSYTYVDDAIEGMIRLMRSDCEKIVNIGSAQLVTINQLIETICYVADKQVYKKYVEGPTGVHGRNSSNTRILKELGWAPATALHVGLKPTYQWVQRQLQLSKKSPTVATDATGDSDVSPLHQG